MSTDLMLRCVDHDPYISSEDVGSNLSYLPAVRADIKNRAHIVANMNALLEDNGWPQYEGYRGTTYWFLYHHPKCNLEIWDEYGSQYSLEAIEGPEEKPIARDTVLGKVEAVTDVPGGVTVFFGNLTPEGERVLRRIQNA